MYRLPDSGFLFCLNFDTTYRLPSIDVAILREYFPFLPLDTMYRLPDSGFASCLNSTRHIDFPPPLSLWRIFPGPFDTMYRCLDHGFPFFLGFDTTYQLLEITSHYYRPVSRPSVMTLLSFLYIPTQYFGFDLDNNQVRRGAGFFDDETDTPHSLSPS